MTSALFLQPRRTGLVLMDLQADAVQTPRAVAPRIGIVPSKAVIAVIGIVIVAGTAKSNPRKLFRSGLPSACNKQ